MLGALMILVFTLAAFNSGADSGKATYLSKCSQCHNKNPSKPGSVGPDIAGSSFELLKFKTQQGGYPVGYKPKRKTLAMPIIKLTDAQIESMRVYIAKFRKTKK